VLKGGIAVWEKILVFILEEHRGKFVGVLLGLIASILFITYGFWRTIFIIACIIMGYIIGKKLDEDKKFSDWFKYNRFKDE